MPSKRYLLAIPVFNEAGHIARVLRRSRVYLSDILVINDGSTDGTAEVLAGQRGLHVIEHSGNRGYGQALAEAFAFSAQRGYDWLITMDCDEQHEPAAIPGFLAAAERDDTDLISGSRYLRTFEGSGTPPADRRAINRIITAELNARLGLGITDAFCGFKAYRVAALADVHITVAGYAMPLQFWVQAACAGMRIIEIPVRLIYNDPTRHFGGLLDDPQVRLRHYLDVFDTELALQRYLLGRRPGRTSLKNTPIACQSRSVGLRWRRRRERTLAKQPSNSCQYAVTAGRKSPESSARPFRGSPAP